MLLLTNLGNRIVGYSFVSRPMPIKWNVVRSGTSVNMHCAIIVITVFTARCTIVQSAVLRSHVVRLSVRLSVCNVCDL